MTRCRTHRHRRELSGYARTTFSTALARVCLVLYEEICQKNTRIKYIHYKEYYSDMFDSFALFFNFSR